ncbi:hypothetical protein VTN00DRAFT_4890 [Thermoascus crustaceus]|uniref:uncharacterized protein n=1 Tax=Thermoascus crustaceus TaxID=5088 RepID=UPI003742E6EC
MTCATDINPSLSSNDAAVLQALFDAESAPSSAVKVDPSLPSFPHIDITPTELEALKSRELHAVRQLQAPSGSVVPRETIRSAVAELDALIAESPSYPSAYVNRAQALRMLINVESGQESKEEDEGFALFAPANSEIASQLFSDLGQAIALATPKSAASSISPAQARLLADAHTHRGYLLLKAARMKAKRKEADARDEEGGPERLRGLGKDEIEEMASRDFFFGGRYGNPVAQQLAVQTNPYAKMCGAIVKEVMRKEVEGS